MSLFVTLSIEKNHNIKRRYAERRYAECRGAFTCANCLSKLDTEKAVLLTCFIINAICCHTCDTDSSLKLVYSLGPML